MYTFGIPATIKKDNKNIKQKQDRISCFFVPVFLPVFLRFIFKMLIINLL